MGVGRVHRSMSSQPHVFAWGRAPLCCDQRPLSLPFHRCQRCPTLLLRVASHLSGRSRQRRVQPPTGADAASDEDRTRTSWRFVRQYCRDANAVRHQSCTAYANRLLSSGTPFFSKKRVSCRSPVATDIVSVEESFACRWDAPLVGDARALGDDEPRRGSLTRPHPPVDFDLTRRGSGPSRRDPRRGRGV
jgi:hypothetical protein